MAASYQAVQGRWNETAVDFEWAWLYHSPLNIRVMAHPIVDESLGKDYTKELLLKKHLKFLVRCKSENDSTLDYCRMSGIYWVLTALDLLDALSEVDENEIVDFVLSCQKTCGGFAPCPKHDAHLLSTLSAIQILAMYDCLNRVNVEAVCSFVSKLQQPDGSFAGDVWGEIDTRFSFCAVATLHIVGMLSKNTIDIEACASYLEKCQNLDGCFGTRPGSESHAGQAYCVVGALAILRQLHRLNIDRAAWWLAERQLPSGGLNGRPEKHPDVCYSWWTVATLTIFGRLTWINQTDLTRFILASQDDQTGGIADKPGNIPDPFHTLFGLAGLSLLAQVDSYFSSSRKMENGVSGVEDPAFVALQMARNNLKTINPVLCMPQYIIDRLQLKFQLL
ncbi:unnamed protein product [Schistosoma margrebowiei]|uniref:Geranylgeranyl transferase type-2 subunit beta n=1 Tax=Schistosoma margrebowiei TaxID=48269 RepID=A0AA85ACL8_9TREM|nr:unnamed protein product [Schistosoma margrebowiei]